MTGKDSVGGGGHVFENSDSLYKIPFSIPVSGHAIYSKVEQLMGSNHRHLRHNSKAKNLLIREIFAGVNEDVVKHVTEETNIQF